MHIDFQSEKYIHSGTSMSRSTHIHCVYCLIYILKFISHHTEHNVIALERPVHLITSRNVQRI